MTNHLFSVSDTEKMNQRAKIVVDQIESHIRIKCLEKNDVTIIICIDKEDLSTIRELRDICVDIISRKLLDDPKQPKQTALPGFPHYPKGADNGTLGVGD